MGVVERFAGEAASYREWVLHGTDSGPPAARNALLHVTRLLLAALHLPPSWNENLESGNPVADGPDLPGVDSVYPRFVARMPFQMYAEVFDPLPIPPQEPVLGDVADDLADIFFEVHHGLRLFAAGRRTDAIWAWGFGFESHWGEHATSAIRALQCWLKAHAPEFLADADAPPNP